MIREAKKKYKRNIIKRSRKNRKVFYKYISRINRKNSFKKVGPLIDQNERIVVEDMEMASLLNGYFASVFNKNEFVDSKLDCTVEIEAKELLSNIEITGNDVIRVITEFKEQKSPGVDGITSTYVLKTKEILVEPLRLMYNKSIDENQIPKDWKKANVSPIFKKGDRSSVENYRPVSLTVMYCKVLEKIIKKNIEILYFLSKIN